jgi:DedD protein
LAVATLGVILVIVVTLMNSLSSNGTNNLPQAALPPKPEMRNSLASTEEPLFEDVQVIEEDANNDVNLDQIARKLKQESVEEEIVSPMTEPDVAKPLVKKSVAAANKKNVAPVASATEGYYVQVGSFSKYEPNKKFLKSITDLNFKYEYYEVTKNSQTLNKVLIGPFNTKKEAEDAKRVIRAKIEPGAFLFKL